MKSVNFKVNRMQIVIKRKDSVVSILLFLFNVFLVDRGITSIPLKKIFRLMEPFQKSETAIRMGLSREIQNGILINKKEVSEVVYCLTDTAVQGFKYWMKTMDHDQKKIQLQFQQWDGQWRILLINNEIGIKSLAENFHEILKQYGYGRLNKNLWISPYNSQEEIIQLTDDLNVGKKIYFFESRLADEGDQTELISEIWPISRLAENYHHFLTSFNNELRHLDLYAYRGGGGLPFLHRFGLEFFEIVREDPHLPLKLLPADWPGVKAAMAFKNIREEILPKANEFINRILDS